MAALSLRTRDGYVTSGRCALASTPSLSSADAARLARASLRLLDDALQYVELSVETLDLGLLARMFADYLCAREVTLVEFTAFGALMVRVASPEQAPEDADGSCIRAQRQALLRTKRDSSTDETLVAARAAICAFLSYLARRVVVRDAERLQALITSWFECDDDATLQRLMRATRCLVCVMPVEKRVPRSEYTPSGLPFERTLLPKMPPVPAQLLSTPRRALQSLPSSRSMSLEPAAKRQRLYFLPEESGTDHSRMENSSHAVSGMNNVPGDVEEPGDNTQHPNEPKRRGRVFSVETSALRQRLAKQLAQYEARRPWKTVFHDALPLPFVEDDAPDLARRLRLFWRNYGRAVWERSFWSPLDKAEYLQRRNRQGQARVFFESIIRMAFDAFGAAFFVRLEKSKHPGWWYKGCVVDLEALSAVIGENAVYDYVATQYERRFPDCGHPLPLEKMRNIGSQRMQQERVMSSAMWLQCEDDDTKRLKKALRRARERLRAQCEVKETSHATVNNCENRYGD